MSTTRKSATLRNEATALAVKAVRQEDGSWGFEVRDTDTGQLLRYYETSRSGDGLWLDVYPAGRQIAGTAQFDVAGVTPRTAVARFFRLMAGDPADDYAWGDIECQCRHEASSF